MRVDELVLHTCGCLVSAIHVGVGQYESGSKQGIISNYTHFKLNAKCLKDLTLI